MFPKLKISSFVLKRLIKIKQQCSGCLFGIMYDGTLLVLGFNIESTIGQLNYKQIQHKFPAEIDLCGLIKFGDCTDSEANIMEILQDVDITDNPILLQCALGTLVDLKASVFMHGKLQEIAYEVISEEHLYRNFCFTRLRCSLNVLTEDNVDSVKRDMQNLRKKLAGGSLAFFIEKSGIYLNGASGTSATPIKGNISDVFDVIKQSSGEPIKSKKQSTLLTDYEILNIEVLKNKSKDISEKSGSAVAMAIKPNEIKLSIPLEIDAMAMLYKNIKLIRVYDILIESLCRSLRLIEQSINDRIMSGNEFTNPHTYHFFVPDFGHFLSCAYLDKIPEDAIYVQQKRKKLHHHFGLPISRPYFRKANRYLFKDQLINCPLINTHVGVKPSGIKDGKQYLVQGKYSYYHYMQHGMNDNGWGCAYRSLQTVCSWFKWQGYTDREIPSHEEIQKYLVEIGDKPRSFIGSRQWIGSTEVSMCLKGLLNVDSKIMHLGSGAEMSTKGYELSMHFESEGTPIMIGGGVLAHTIIGIDMNTSGDIKFLILDPHYTDVDDINTIQAKGWCGWKGCDFWDKKSYYNLCMPLRPIMY